MGACGARSIHQYFLLCLSNVNNNSDGDDISGMSRPRGAMVSLMLLISWKMWKEKNVRVFHNNVVPVGVLVARTKEEASLWCLARVKFLCNIMSRQ